jgi:hypothetical protein
MGISATGAVACDAVEIIGLPVLVFGCAVSENIVTASRALRVAASVRRGTCCRVIFSSLLTATETYELCPRTGLWYNGSVSTFRATCPSYQTDHQDPDTN